LRQNGAYREHATGRHAEARWTDRFEDVLEDESVDAVVVATDVPTHYRLAKAALEAGKHVFVEKPPAMRSAEMDELVALAAERDLVLMPGHLLLYHPGDQKLKDLIETGALGDVLYIYGQRVNFGPSAPSNARSLGVHDLSVILYLLRGPTRRSRWVATSGRRRGRRLATCASRRERRRTCTSRGSTRTNCGR
jgi:predicted dehydrogenase